MFCLVVLVPAHQRKNIFADMKKHLDSSKYSRPGDDALPVRYLWLTIYFAVLGVRHLAKISPIYDDAKTWNPSRRKIPEKMAKIYSSIADLKISYVSVFPVLQFIKVEPDKFVAHTHTFFCTNGASPVN